MNHGRTFRPQGRNGLGGVDGPLIGPTGPMGTAGQNGATGATGRFMFCSMQPCSMRLSLCACSCAWTSRMPDKSVRHLEQDPRVQQARVGRQAHQVMVPSQRAIPCHAMLARICPLQQTAGLTSQLVPPHAGVCAPVIPVSGYSQCCTTTGPPGDGDEQCLRLTAPGSGSGSCAYRVGNNPSSTASRLFTAMHGLQGSLRPCVMHRCARGLAGASASAPRPSMWAALASARCSTRTRARPPSMAAARPWPPISALAPTARACSFQPRPSSANPLPGSAPTCRPASASTRPHTRARLQAAPSASTAPPPAAGPRPPPPAEGCAVHAAAASRPAARPPRHRLALTATHGVHALQTLTDNTCSTGFAPSSTCVGTMSGIPNSCAAASQVCSGLVLNSNPPTALINGNCDDSGGCTNGLQIGGACQLLCA